MDIRTLLQGNRESESVGIRSWWWFRSSVLCVLRIGNAMTGPGTVTRSDSSVWLSILRETFLRGQNEKFSSSLFVICMLNLIICLYICQIWVTDTVPIDGVSYLVRRQVLKSNKLQYHASVIARGRWYAQHLKEGIRNSGTLKGSLP